MSRPKENLTNEQAAVRRSVGKKKRKKILKTILIVLILAIVALFLLHKAGIIGKKNIVHANTLTTYTTGTRSITKVLTSSGTIEPNDQYTINALVSGEIIADYFEEGDTVIEDQLLYSFDSDNLNSSVTRAENALKNANSALNDALENLEKLNVESEHTGTIKKLYVEVGDEISSGTLIADVIDDSVMCIDIPFMDVDCSNIRAGQSAVITFDSYEETVGEVKEVSPVKHINALGVSVRNVTISVKNTGSITTSTRAFAQIGDAYCTADAAFYNNEEGQIYSKVAGEVTKIYYDEGDKIYDGNVIVRLESEDLEEQIDKLKDSVTEAEDSLDDANDAFDNYNVEAPITGKVISKNYKTGDTLSGGQSSSGTLAVIYDMSALKFTMNIDELDIDKLDKGQDVIITCDSRQGEEYHGTITNISIQGSTSNGTTVYPVEVKIENVEDIDKRTVSEDGTINKVYKTGMTSTENVYSLVKTESVPSGTVYVYTDEIRITRTSDGRLYDGEKQLKSYLNGSYTQGSNFYTFSNNFSTLTLEVQNDKKMLRPGMNIDAEIIVERRENVIAVPLAAVGRGNIVKVISQNADNAAANSNEDTSVSENAPGFDGKFENMPQDAAERFKNMNRDNIDTEMPSFDGNMSQNMPVINQDGGLNRTAGDLLNVYGTADPNTQYTEVRVTVGISDDDFVEITSGLSVGDVVIIDNSNVASGYQNMQFGMMGSGMMGGMNGGAMMGGGMPSGAMVRGPMGVTR